MKLIIDKNSTKDAGPEGPNCLYYEDPQVIPQYTNQMKSTTQVLMNK